MNVMFVMGWSLKMRHACDFMVIERIGSLMNMSYGNLISWRHDMALFCFRHGQLQMREGVKVPNPTSGWTQSTRSRRRRVQTGGSCAMLALGDTGQNLFRTSYSVSMLEVSLKMKNPSMSHNMSLVRFTNSLTSSCLASVSHGSLPMTCSICSWIFSCFNRNLTMTCPTCWWHAIMFHMGVWPWHVQHAHDLQHAPHMGLWYHMLTFDDFCLSQAPYHGHNLIRKGQWAYGRLAGSRLSWWSGTVFQGTWATSFPPWRWIRICGLQTKARSKTCSGSTAIPSWQLRFW